MANKGEWLRMPGTRRAQKRTAQIRERKGLQWTGEREDRVWALPRPPCPCTHSGPRLRSVCVSPAAGAQGERRGARTRSRDPFIGFGISPVPGRRQTVQLCACARVSCTCTGLRLAHRTRCGVCAGRRPAERAGDRDRRARAWAPASLRSPETSRLQGPPVSTIQLAPDWSLEVSENMVRSQSYIYAHTHTQRRKVYHSDLPLKVRALISSGSRHGSERRRRE